MPMKKWRLRDWQAGVSNALPFTRRPSVPPPRRALLVVEALESRFLLAAAPSPLWSLLGPAPQRDAQGILDKTPGEIGAARPGDVSGRVSALAFSRDIGGGQPAFFLGSASGGVWRTTSFV